MERPPLRALCRMLLPYVAVWAAVAAALAAFSMYEVTGSRHETLENARAELTSIARLTSEHAHQAIQGAERNLATARALRNAMGPQFVALLPAFDTAVGIERETLLFDRTGGLVARSGSARVDPAAAVSIADQPHFIDARDRPGEGLHIGAPVASRAPRRVIVPLVVRLDAADGTFDGVLMAALDPVRLVAVYRSVRFGQSAHVGLMRRDGLMYAQDGDASAARDEAGLVGALALTLGAAGTADTSYLRLEHDGPAFLVATAPVPGTGLVAYAAMSENEALEQHARLARNIAMLAFVALLAVTLPLGMVMRRAILDFERRRDLELRYANERRRARRDPLTGVANRIAFDDQLQRCNRRLAREGAPFVLAIIDLDRFKALNDTRGHLAGDDALRRIARALVSNVRATDLVARLGGDEFAVIMPGANADTSPRACGKLHAALLATAAAAELPIGFSIGVVAFEDAPADLRAVTALADRLMYDVKSGGGEGVRYGVYRRGALDLPSPDTERMLDAAA